MNYFPFLRGKQNELIATRDLAPLIVEDGRVIPIIEPVNANTTTRISIGHFVEISMPFLFICNPIHGEFSYNSGRLARDLIDETLTGYDNWTPSLYVHGRTTAQVLEGFVRRYGGDYPLALIYYGYPQGSAARAVIGNNLFRWHVIMDGRVETEYVQSLKPDSCVRIFDRFVRQPRNADYPTREFFTDLNTIEGNSDRSHFGDFSIVGDYFTTTGGAAHAVALHHIHFAEHSRDLHISHFISDRTETSADTPGKIIEAVSHLVDALDTLRPNDTQACQKYREMEQNQQARGLGYMKRLAIKHHLETMLGNGLEE